MSPDYVPVSRRVPGTGLARATETQAVEISQPHPKILVSLDSNLETRLFGLMSLLAGPKLIHKANSQGAYPWSKPVLPGGMSGGRSTAILGLVMGSWGLSIMAYQRPWERETDKHFVQSWRYQLGHKVARIADSVFFISSGIAAVIYSRYISEPALSRSQVIPRGALPRCVAAGGLIWMGIGIWRTAAIGLDHTLPFGLHKEDFRDADLRGR